LLASNALPLFELTLRQGQTNPETQLNAASGWHRVSLRKAFRGFLLRWERTLEGNATVSASGGPNPVGGEKAPTDMPRSGQPTAPRITQPIVITATATADAGRSAWRWQLHVENPNPDWSVWRVTFPQIALAPLGDGTAVLFPRGPGEVQAEVWTRPFNYRGNYPSGWCSMQFMALYRRADNPAGLYLAVHDPLGSTKDIVLESDPTNRCVRMRYEHPAPDMGRGGNDFDLSGEAVWQLLRGDWFDAAMVYKAWARQNARWWPQLTAAGRKDTALWMRELSAWVMTGGAASNCVSRVQQFQRLVDVPVGFHWYNWHQIPFDNDYPHYFPAKTDFASGVQELKKSSVFVMPYINGRLWDTHDRGADDFEFTKRALPAATKDANGKPYVESYGSKETNGNPVRLAAMCPTTPLWQQTVRDIVLKLLQEVGTSSVYIDQVAAASPRLCMDAAHGHQLGGGHWWNEGYWRMLQAIRQAMPADRMLTTECNAESFVRWFDGYLTWHWQHDGQVPAFPAVYGGAVQMFGRAYRGGATKDLAMRMKAGQQLVFGEQIGWFDPDIIQDRQNADFLRQAVRLRCQLRHYFYRGEMARPPQLLGPISTVKADWQWSGEWWVRTDAVLTGAWQIPKEKHLVLLFANVSDQPVTATLRFSPATYKIQARTLACTVFVGDKPAAERQVLPAQFERSIEFPPRQALAWELRW
jgi:hypothetical protein